MDSPALARLMTLSRVSGLRVFVVTATLAYCAVPAAPSHAGSPPRAPTAFPGFLVFVNRTFDGKPPTIWTMLPGSSRETEVAHAKVSLIAAAISPNGEEIAFDRDVDYRYTDARDRLVISSPDGSDKRVLRSACSGYCHWIHELDWAPDGQTILMWRCVGLCPKNGYHLSHASGRSRTDGTDLQQLTFPGAYTHTNELNDHNPESIPRLATNSFRLRIASMTPPARPHSRSHPSTREHRLRSRSRNGWTRAANLAP